MTEQTVTDESTGAEQAIEPVDATPAVEAVEVVLIADRHEHDGRRYARGDRFTVPLDLVAVLRVQGIAEPAQ